MAEQFLHIMERDRDMLPFFLKDNGDYDTLKDTIQKTEEILQNLYPEKKKFNWFSKLMLGNTGYESNKQRCLYELPTNELLKTIETVCHELEIPTVENIMVGQGLLSRMLKDTTDLTVKSTDGLQWIQTFGKKYVNDVVIKVFTRYLMEYGFDDRLLIFSWLPIDTIGEVKKFIETKKPKYMMFIGEFGHKISSFKTIEETLSSQSYHTLLLPVKQLCYQDYFINNKFFPEDCSRSMVMLCIRQDQNQEPFDDTVIKCSCAPFLWDKIVDRYDDSVYIQDLVAKGVLGNYLLTEMENKTSEQIKEIVKFCGKIYYNKVPKFIDSYQDAKFYMDMVALRRYPKQITCLEKFKEYKELYNRVNMEGFQALVALQMLPPWISSNTEAEMYFYMEFSYSRKKWKVNRHTFMMAIHNPLYLR